MEAITKENPAKNSLQSKNSAALGTLFPNILSDFWANHKALLCCYTLLFAFHSAQDTMQKRSASILERRI
jgi:hypothetical protein